MAAILTLVLLFGLTSGYAGDVARTGTAAGLQATVPVGARYLAMGGANISNVSGVDGIFWNPAGLSSMKGAANAVFSTMTIFNDVKVNYLGLGFNMGSLGALGVTLKAFDFGDIPLTTTIDPDGASGRTFSPTFVTAGLTYGAKLTESIKIGVTGKLLYESAANVQASAFALDAGIEYNKLAGIEGLSVGVVIRNIGSNIKYQGSGLNTQATEQGIPYSDFLKRDAASNQLPASISLGVGYKLAVDETNNVRVVGNFDNNNFGSDVYKAGAEYMYSDLFAVRAGYLYYADINSDEAPYTFTVGAGFHYNVGGVDLSLDYAYRDVQYFNGNNLFSLKIGF